MVKKTLHYLITDPQGIYVDCTLGSGGHFQAIAESLKSDAVLIGFDEDKSAINYCKENFDIDQREFLYNTNFSNLKKTIYRAGYTKVNGIFFDLGISSMEIDDSGRGFSHSNNGPLDMRFSQDNQETAKSFINTASVALLEKVFREFGEERGSFRIAKAIYRSRQDQEIETTRQLRNIIARSVTTPNMIKTLSRVFQAIRIYVNEELDVLKDALPQAVELLVKGGQAVLISYHSLEDRIVKQFLKNESKDCICPPEFPQCQCDHKASIEILTKKPIIPDSEEVKLNPRSRSAKLRAFRKKI